MWYICLSGDLRNRTFNWPFECHTNFELRKQIFVWWKFQFAKIKLCAPAMLSMFAAGSSRRCFFFSFLIFHIIIHTFRSGHEQHNYDGTCAFFIIHSTPDVSFSSGPIRCAFWIKNCTETAQRITASSSIDVALGSSIHIYFWFSEFRSSFFVFYTSSTHFSFQNGLVVRLSVCRNYAIKNKKKKNTLKQRDQ